MNTKKIIVWVAVVIVLAGGYVALAKSQHLWPFSWSTYINTQYGFEFKYPSNWFIYEPAGESRVFIQTVPGEVNKGTAPSDFKRIWISWDPKEVSGHETNWTDSSGRKYTIILASEVGAQNEQQESVIAGQISSTFKFLK